jgi:PKD repeat protein
LKRLYGESVYYTFTTPGTYQITLLVKDHGGNSDTAITWVNVSAVTGTGNVTGTVRDKDGNPIAGALVYVNEYPNISSSICKRIPEHRSYNRFIWKIPAR